MKYCVLNKRGKFGANTFSHYIDIVIFVLCCSFWLLTRLMMLRFLNGRMYDDNLLANIRHNPHHLLHKLLPDITDHTSYNLRPRCHSFSLSVKTDSRNYINRMLSKDIY